MSYTPPAGDAANFSWAGDVEYTPPPGDAADFSWVPSTSLAELVFELPPVVGAPHLVFGLDGSEPTVTDAHATVTATFVRPTLTATARLGIRTAVTATFVRPTLTVSATYDTDTQRPLVLKTDSVFEDASDIQVPLGVVYQDAASLPDDVAALFQDAIPVDTEAMEKFEEANRVFLDTVGVFEDAAHRKLEADVFFEDSTSIKHFVDGVFEDGHSLRFGAIEGFQDADRLIRNQLRGVFEDASALQLVLATSFGEGVVLWMPFPATFEEAMRPPPGISSFGPEPPQPPDPCYIPNAHLVFSFPQVYSPHLVFQCGDYIEPEEPPLPVPTGLKTYIIMNSLTFKRVVDNEPIAILGATVSTDTGSWCWALQAELPWTELEKVEPSMAGAVEVELEMNGFIWRFLVEGYTENKVFGKTTISIRGRSLTAYLSQPYSFLRSYVQDQEYQSRQIADDAVTYAGVPSGFTVDWSLVNSLGWTMPTGSFNYTSLSPVQVVQALAEGGGGFVNSHPSQKKLLVAPEYPEPFWDWAGMAAGTYSTIPKSLVFGQSLDWREAPAYNGVYVMGENTGVSAWVKRTGTDGAFLAPPVVNQMVTHESAARSKGISILSAGGKQADITLTLPLHPDLGLLAPGRVMEVVTDIGVGAPWRGLSRGVAINAQTKNSLVIRQALRLERHYGGL